MKKIFVFVILSVLIQEVKAQKWVVKDSILVFPSNFYSWLKRNNGGIDTTAPGNVGNYQPGKIGTNQGVDVFDFNKDGLADLTFEIHPHNTITREYLKAIFIQNKEGKYVLDTNYVIKGKGDMWYGGYADFNGDGLMDYHYITHNYHGADSNRIYNPEMVIDDWPDRVFMNNGKSFDTLSLDPWNFRILSTYTADIDGDGADEIVATHSDRYTIATNIWKSSRITVYKYDKALKKFYEIGNELTELWNQKFSPQFSGVPVFSIAGVNNKDEFYATVLDSASGYNIWDYNKITVANYSFKTKKLTTYALSRDSIFIPEKYSKSGVDNPSKAGDDYFKFMIHNLSYGSLIDLDANGEKEIIIGGFYQNNHNISKEKYAYGWRVLGLNGKDLTNQFFNDNGIDRGTDLISHMIDIDDNNPGPEWIPGVWGLDPKYYIDGSPTLGYYYKYANGKMQKMLIRDIIHESGKKLDSNYFFEMQTIKYPNFAKNKNAVLMFDFWNLKRTAILYQASCAGAVKPTFDKSAFNFCTGDSLSLNITNVNRGDSIKWYYGNKVDLSNISTKRFGDTTTLYVLRTDSLGCTKSSDTIRLTKYPVANTTFTINTAAQCLKDNAFSFTNASTISSGTLTYAWNFGDGGTATSANANRSYMASGTFSVKLISTSSFGCKDSTLKLVTVNPMPVKPVIAWDGMNLSTSGTYASYQWILNNAAVAGATSSTHKPVSAGNYTLKVTTTPGCVDTSGIFTLLVTAASNVNANAAIKIYPNPAANSVFIDLGKIPQHNVVVQLISLDGKLINRWVMQQRKQEFSVQSLPSGSYWIQIMDGKTKTTHKLLTQTL